MSLFPLLLHLSEFILRVNLIQSIVTLLWIQKYNRHREAIYGRNGVMCCHSAQQTIRHSREKWKPVRGASLTDEKYNLHTCSWQTAERPPEQGHDGRADLLSLILIKHSLRVNISTLLPFKCGKYLRVNAFLSYVYSLQKI